MERAQAMPQLPSEPFLWSLQGSEWPVISRPAPLGHVAKRGASSRATVPPSPRHEPRHHTDSASSAHKHHGDQTSQGTKEPHPSLRVQTHLWPARNPGGQPPAPRLCGTVLSHIWSISQVGGRLRVWLTPARGLLPGTLHAARAWASPALRSSGPSAPPGAPACPPSPAKASNTQT